MKEWTKDDVPMMVAIGVLISIVASLAHEAIGHGLGCAVDGGHITLITFLVFRCAGAGTLADGGGPIGVLLVGCAALALIHVFRSKALAGRLFLLNLGAIMLFWVCGQAIEEAFDGSDDWGHVANDLGWPSYWQCTLGFAGVSGYIITMRIIGRLGSVLANGRPVRMLLPYAATMLSAIVLGSLWHGGRAASALDGFLSFGVAPIGYLLIARRLAHDPSSPDTVSRSTGFIVFVAAIWLVFAIAVAKGLGPLS